MIEASVDEIRQSIALLQKEVTILEKNEAESDILKAYAIALDSMSRNVPRRVKIEDWSASECPRCGEELSEFLGDGYYRHPTYLKRCPNEKCSQMLKW